MSSVRRLHELLDHIGASGGASRFEVLRVFPLARELAEARPALGQFPTVKFFGDWMLHPQLDRAPARRLLSRVGEIVDRHRSGDPGMIVREISEALSMARLRAELEILFAATGVPLFLLAMPEPWTQCASWLLQDLLNKPIIGSKFTLEEIRTGWGTAPRTLRLTADPQPGSDIMWRVEMGPRITLSGVLLNS